VPRQAEVAVQNLLRSATSRCQGGPVDRFERLDLGYRPERFCHFRRIRPSTTTVGRIIPPPALTRLADAGSTAFPCIRARTCQRRQQAAKLHGGIGRGIEPHTPGLPKRNPRQNAKSSASGRESPVVPTASSGQRIIRGEPVRHPLVEQHVRTDRLSPDPATADQSTGRRVEHHVRGRLPLGSM